MAVWEKNGDMLDVRGFFTQEKFLIGRSIRDWEKLLGFQTGRLDGGLVLVHLTEIPAMDAFELKGYSIVPDDEEFEKKYKIEEWKRKDLNAYLKVKQNAQKSWRSEGPDRLVKVMPFIMHRKDKTQYPPGLGVPQWKLTKSVHGRVVARYEAGYMGIHKPLR